ncbi:urease accessory protein UreF [Candidatus Cetobacterium colombiensis]|uniref:Urease accessory protein UreF n=1 Tax=Candidatus Cetobacterium colombiensis TaxID=3073100 RepID=A0ABU4W877_9FUSO|nr:urease accessory protein UreF [Candidatus Cetobacterium colombiensis]MDX8335242.1 urease accessory protein UreF [Candidatus Cetobacterium colombiensis]
MIDNIENEKSVSTWQLLNILQVCDSAFPIGSFNHSYGMETYLRENVICDAHTFNKWLTMFFENQYLYNEGLAIKLVYEMLDKNEKNEVWNIDQLLTVQNVAMESREGAKLIAFRKLDIVLELFDIDLLKEYKKRIEENLSYGNPAVAFAILMHYLKIKKDVAIVAYGYSVSSTLVQSAVRAIPLGQKDGQRVLQNSLSTLEDIREEIEKLSIDDLGYNIPGFEISQMNHEVLTFRLFMS